MFVGLFVVVVCCLLLLLLLFDVVRIWSCASWRMCCLLCVCCVICWFKVVWFGLLGVCCWLMLLPV